MTIPTDLYADLAAILMDAIADTEQYKESFEKDWGSKPTSNARNSHRQSVVIARLRCHPILAVDERYADGGQVRIRGLEQGATVLLKPRRTLLPPPCDTQLSVPGLPPGGIPLLAYDTDSDGVVEFSKGSCRRIQMIGRTQFQILDALTLAWSNRHLDAFDQHAGDTPPTSMPEQYLGGASSGIAP